VYLLRWWLGALRAAVLIDERSALCAVWCPINQQDPSPRSISLGTKAWRNASFSKDEYCQYKRNCTNWSTRVKKRGSDLRIRPPQAPQPSSEKYEFEFTRKEKRPVYNNPPTLIGGGSNLNSSNTG